MGKKIPKEMATQKEKFFQGAIDNGVPPEKAIKLWGLIEPFASYGFNKAHAASYAMIAYQTAYMKANFPVEFMAAVLSAEADDVKKVASAVAECATLGIEVLPPDVNESLSNFTVLNEKQIRFGLSAVKNLGSDVIKTIIAEQKQNGPFNSLADFTRRLRTRNFNKKSWEALVKSGSLDRFGERNQMLANTENILEYGRMHQRQLAAGQSMLLGIESGSDTQLVLRPVTPATETERLSWEKELLGLYVSSHPLKKYQAALARYALPIKNLNPDREGEYVTVGGIITRIQNILTKKGEQMCFADLEDLEGSLELVVFPNIFNQARNLLAVDQIVLVRGRTSDKEGELKILVDKIAPIEDPAGLQKSAPPSSLPYQGTSLKIRIPQTASPLIFNNLKTLFAKYPGTTAITLIIPDREGAVREIKTDFKVENTESFKTELIALLRESVKK
jgi:DNA polymerase-3 subunit alpha